MIPLYDTSGVVKFIEKVEWWRLGSFGLMDVDISVCEDEKVLVMDGGVAAQQCACTECHCTVHFTWLKLGKFYVIYILPQ